MLKLNCKKIKKTILERLIKIIVALLPNKKHTRAFLRRHWIATVKKYMNTLEWINANNLSSNYKVIKKAEKLEYKIPKHAEEELWYIFNNEYNTQNLKETFLVTLPNARYIPCWNSFITQDNILLNDLSLEFGEPTDLKDFEHNVFTEVLPAETYIDENIAILNSAGSTNYFHWVINILPKIEFFEQSDIKIDKYLVDISQTFQIDSLKKIGFDMDKILPVSTVENLRAKNIIAANLPSVALANISSLDFIRKKLNIENNQTTERIYISRQKAKQGRSITNEEEILKALSPLGFKSYILEDMTFDEQVELFSRAEIVIGAHGAGLTNILFCKKGTKIVEISNPKYRARCYFVLANILNHDYYNILGEGEIPGENSKIYDCSGNITLDINKFKRLLDLVNIENIKI